MGERQKGRGIRFPKKFFLHPGLVAVSESVYTNWRRRYTSGRLETCHPGEIGTIAVKRIKPANSRAQHDISE
jgi:hypothetical protein